VILNPGTQTKECYADSANVIVYFEDTYDAYARKDGTGAYEYDKTEPAWVHNYPPSLFWHLVHSAPDEAAMRDAVGLGKQRGAYHMYVTPDVLCNPWDTLPSDPYWSEELTALESPGTPQPTYAPTHDARVEEANPSTNYGGSSILRTDGGAGSRVDTYLQYAVTNIPAGEKVQSAKLRVYDTDNCTADGPAVHTSATGWSESSITWTNRPAKSGSGVADKGAVASASWVEFDVTPLVTSNATYSFVLSQPGADGANYASKEHSEATKKPQLVVTTGTTTNATLVGAGDIATGGSDTEATAKLVRSIPDTVFTSGDNAYPDGTDANFSDFYRGRLRPYLSDGDLAQERSCRPSQQVYLGLLPPPPL
jgi:hypothetical protein